MAKGTWTLVVEADAVREGDVKGYRFYAGGVVQGEDVAQGAGNPRKTITLNQADSTIPELVLAVTAIDQAGNESLRTEKTIPLDADAPTKPGELRLVSAVFVPAAA